MISASKFLDLIQDENNVVTVEGIVASNIVVKENKVFFYVEQGYYDCDGAEYTGFQYNIGSAMSLTNSTLRVQMTEISPYLIAKKITF